jgi:malto-oligosyltrehalose synthase
VVVEKILAPGERLPPDWDVQGTTGYDFMDEVGALLHEATGAGTLDRLWREVGGDPRPLAEPLWDARREILERHFASDRERCVIALAKLAARDPTMAEYGRNALRRVLTEILVAFPAYRTYPGAHAGCAQDSEHLSQARALATGWLRPQDHALMAWILDRLAPVPRPRGRARVARRRLQQLLPPLAAKALEDTLFYRYGRALSRNEVGSVPDRLALTAAQFHERMRQRAQDLPRSLLATATHDHKRGEDARARLAVLSELAPEWAQRVTGWRESHAARRGDLDEADAYMLYQTLVGAWPLAGEPDDDFADRIVAWQRKALREGKQRSSWAAPDETYEAAAEAYARGLLATEPANTFRDDLRCWVGRVAAAGAANALTQTLLRLTVPGVPDVYQGTEFWDFSLVDPDNRRAVDYAARYATLTSPAGREALLAQWRDGAIKQQVIARTLALRSREAGLFECGEYLPVAVEGPLAAHVLAWARRLDDRYVLGVALHHPARLLDDASVPAVPAEAWAGTRLQLTPGVRTLEDAWFGGELMLDDGGIDVDQALAGWPVALYIGTCAARTP